MTNLIRKRENIERNVIGHAERTLMLREIDYKIKKKDLKDIPEGEKKLNFGCGNHILEGFDNIDKKDFDFNKFPYPIKDNTYDYVYSRCVLEHLFYLRDVLKELARICKNNAKIFIIVPYYNSYGAFSHIDHLHFFNEKSWKDIQIEELKVEKIKCIPSKVGFLIPFRRFFARYFNGLIKQIHITIRVKK